MKKSKWFQLIILLIIIVLFFLYRLIPHINKKDKAFSSSLIKSPAKTTTVAVPPRLSVKSNKNKAYPFYLIQKKVAHKVDRWELCALAHWSSLSGQVIVNLNFSHQANLIKVYLSHKKNKQFEHCLFKEISSWKLPPHPRKMDFSYSFKLKL